METLTNSPELEQVVKPKKRGRPRKNILMTSQAIASNVSRETEMTASQELNKKIETLEAQLQKLKEKTTVTSQSAVTTFNTLDPQYQRQVLSQQLEALKKKYEKEKSWEEVKGQKVLKMTQIFYEYPPGVHPSYPNGGIEKGSKHSLYLRRADFKEQTKKLRDL